MLDTSLETLAGKLATAKREESEANSRRTQLEEEIAVLVETPENGSKTVQAGSGLKVTVKRALGYKADVDAIRNMELENMPVKLTPAKWEFDKKEYERIVKESPDIAAKLAEFVTATPHKVSVSLKIG